MHELICCVPVKGFGLRPQSLRDSLRSPLTSRCIEPVAPANNNDFLYNGKSAMEKQPRQLTLLSVPEPPHRDALLLTRQLQQQEADYHEGLRADSNQEQAKAYQLPLLKEDGTAGEAVGNEVPQVTPYPCLAQGLAGLCWLDER